MLYVYIQSVSGNVICIHTKCLRKWFHANICYIFLLYQIIFQELHYFKNSVKRNFFQDYIVRLEGKHKFLSKYLFRRLSIVIRYTRIGDWMAMFLFLQIFIVYRVTGQNYHSFNYHNFSILIEQFNQLFVRALFV